MLKRGAFSIIELLVITSVIIVLCAVLSPVLRWSGPASGEAESLANIGQLQKSMRLYYADYDEVRLGRQSVNATQCLSWKQVLDPYVAEPLVYLNPGNPASGFPDVFSDPAMRAMLCPTSGSAMTGVKAHPRGFYWNNLFGKRSDGSIFDGAGLTLASLAKPETTGDLVEGKSAFSDTGALSTWLEDVDAESSWIGPTAPQTGLKWNMSSGHYGDREMNVTYVDGHAAHVTFVSLCNPWISVDTAGKGTVTDPTYQTFWNFSAKEIKDMGPGFDWLNPATQNYCTSMVAPPKAPLMFHP